MKCTVCLHCALIIKEKWNIVRFNNLFSIRYFNFESQEVFVCLLVHPSSFSSRAFSCLNCSSSESSLTTSSSVAPSKKFASTSNRKTSKRWFRGLPSSVPPAQLTLSESSSVETSKTFASTSVGPSKTFELRSVETSKRFALRSVATLKKFDLRWM